MQDWILLIVKVFLCVLMSWIVLRDIQKDIEAFEQKEIDEGSSDTFTDSKNHNGRQ